MSGTLALRYGFLLSLIVVFGAGTACASSAPCKSSDLQVAKRAQSDAEGSLQSVINFIKEHDTKTKTLMLRWFGSNDQSTADKVSGMFERSRQWLQSVKFSCLYQNDGSYVEDVDTPSGAIRVDRSDGLFAYVLRADLGTIYLGLKFFTAPASTGYDSKLGTLIHEMTHFWITGNTNSTSAETYDKGGCLELAKSNPSLAQANAENYEYFVEEWLNH